MSLKEKLLEDMKTAMKEKQEIRKNAIIMVRSAILQVEKDSKIVLDEEGVIEVIAKELKKRRDSMTEFQKSNREDLITSLNKEIEILLAYLPEQLSELELDEIVKKTIEETNVTSIKEIGKIMPAVLAKVKGRADGRMVNQLIRKYLQ